MTGLGLYDPTSIMNADVLTKCQREGWIKLAFYLLSFFYYLYGYVLFMVKYERVNFISLGVIATNIYLYILDISVYSSYVTLKCDFFFKYFLLI
jgi:hypothetical protein